MKNIITLCLYVLYSYFLYLAGVDYSNLKSALCFWTATIFISIAHAMNRD